MSKRLLVIIAALLLMPLAALAQEKSDWDYIKHPEEILPDAKSLFAKGDYNRVLILCNIHKEVRGEDHPEAAEIEALRQKTIKARELVAEIAEQLADNHPADARDTAEELQEINPNDEWIAKVGLVQEPVEVSRPRSAPEYDDMHIVPKLGFGLFGLSQSSVSFAPSLGAAVYNIAYTPLGAELNFFFDNSVKLYSDNPYLKDILTGASITGASAKAVMRLGEIFYPALGIGFFSCRHDSSYLKRSTSGLFVPASVTVIIGGRFALEAGVSFFPEVKMLLQSTAYVEKLEYSFYDMTSMTGGIVPSISVGYAF